MKIERPVLSYPICVQRGIARVISVVFALELYITKGAIHLVCACEDEWPDPDPGLDPGGDLGAHHDGQDRQPGHQRRTVPHDGAEIGRTQAEAEEDFDDDLWAALTRASGLAYR